MFSGPPVPPAIDIFKKDKKDFVEKGDFTDLEELFNIAKIQYENAREEIKLLGGDYLVENLRDAQTDCLYDLSNFLRKHIIAITIQKNGSMNMLTREHDYDINFGKPIFIAKKFKNYKLTKQH